MDNYSVKALAKIIKAMREFLDSRDDRRPKQLAWEWVTLPHDVQEPFAETVFQYIQDLAEMEVNSETPPTMRIYRDIARDLTDHILNPPAE